MSSRKKNLLLIQITIFLVASALLYNTYSDKSTNERKSFVKIEAETSPETNSFTDIEYSGFDLNGNRYVLKAVQANFETETPQIINMKIVKADFFLKDGTILTIISDEGVYNNVTLDMNFKETANKILEENDDDHKERNKKLIRTLRSLAHTAEFNQHDGADPSIFDNVKKEWAYLRDLHLADRAEYEDWQNEHI